MTTAVITLQHICSGGGHLQFAITIDGGAQHVIDTDINNLQEPLSDEEKVAFIKSCVKLSKIGKTWAQVKTGFQNGVQVMV